MVLEHLGFESGYADGEYHTDLRQKNRRTNGKYTLLKLRIGYCVALPTDLDELAAYLLGVGLGVRLELGDRKSVV